MAILIILIILAVFGYYGSLRVHPLTKCKACNGTARHYGSGYPNVHRKCRKCGGTGRKNRLGVRLFVRPDKK